jgi:enamine deaminase RidA (YjgF/YER057c/UK114 family)
MNRPSTRRFGTAFILAGILFALVAVAPAQEIKRFPRPDRPGTAWAVRVDDAALGYTGPILPWDPTGSVSADLGTQARQALANLKAVLAKAGSDEAHIIRINVYVTGEAVAAALDAAVATEFTQNPSVVTWVRSPVGEPGAALALDAIAVLPRSDRAPRRISSVNVPGAPAAVRVAVMPPGDKVFISGETAAGPDFTGSVTGTLAALGRDLQFLGLAKSDVVQIKAILQPFPQQAAMEKIVADFFAGSVPPPLVIVEGGLPQTTAVEIEMTVAGSPQRGVKSGGPVTYQTFPGHVHSTRFSNVATVPAGVPLIFTAGLEGRPASDSRGQIEQIFSRLGEILFETGGSFSSLVKTTGYYTDKPGGRALSEIRGVYYNPAALPASTHMPAFGIGRPGLTCTLDCISAAVAK